MGEMMVGFGLATILLAITSHIFPADPGPAPALVFVSAICLVLIGLMMGIH